MRCFLKKVLLSANTFFRYAESVKYFFISSELNFGAVVFPTGFCFLSAIVFFNHAVRDGVKRHKIFSDF